jgi:hypothetical protein
MREDGTEHTDRAAVNGPETKSTAKAGTRRGITSGKSWVRQQGDRFSFSEKIRDLRRSGRYT